MDAIEFLKNCQRICNKNSNCCGECLLSRNGACALTKDNPENIVLIVEQWAKFHPVNTHMSEFLEHYPEAPLAETDGLPVVSPCYIDPKYKQKRKSTECEGYSHMTCSNCRKEYWLKEIE